MKNFCLSAMALLCSFLTFSQVYFPANKSVKTTETNYTAITNAKLYITPDKVVDKGTLLIKDGKIVTSGVSVNIPDNSMIVDASGKSVYASFIDVFSDFGTKKPSTSDGSWRSAPQYDAGRKGYYWNDHIMPEKNTVDHFEYDAKKAKELLEAGFGVVNTHVQDGVMRGTGALVALNGDENSGKVLDKASAQYLSFSKSAGSKQAYPTSLMGSMALLRQVYYDADWYAKGLSETKDLSLEAVNQNKNLPPIFYAGSRANVLRADKVGDQFNIQYTIVGGGDEYERLNDIKATNAKLVLPVNFPDAYDVDNVFLANSLSLSNMRQWNQKPANPKLLAENRITFALTAHGLKSPKDFKENVLKAIEYGLSKEDALKALTIVPTEILGKQAEIGSLENGRYANFIITSGDVFDKETTLYENWVQGYRTVLKDMNTTDIDGDYEFKLNGESYKLSVKNSLEKPKAEMTSDSIKLGANLSYKNETVQLAFTTKDTVSKQFIRVVAQVVSPKTLKGKAILSNGNEVPFNAKASVSEDKSSSGKPSEDKEDKPELFPVTYPNTAYGFSEQPNQETLLFKNATVWTNEADGILKNTDVLIKNGKIAKIGQNLSADGAKTIDATGKHLTSGIIDEHSHIATAAVNESGHNSSAEVTIEDVVDERSIDIYRNLAGGVTSIQILHGSANPIGGRSAIIKLKWGEAADDLIYEDSPKFIKFALGENVKQSNWGSTQTIRFPQSRMGVEQVYLDYFTRAKEYDAKKKSGKPYRYDLELETLAEILNKERFITCHSYVQSEINMLMKVAEKFDFNINTFTHILEGYKVAKKMKAHGVGGSTFSDWWAYKFEVNDAIPYNAAIMHEAGITVAINSDDAEMSRRLNQEAAKSVKYGGVSEEEALKFVTLNPAKLLHIDHRVGSLKTGKDADVVLWSDHPLSIYAKAEKTIIEGVTYFDIERDAKLRKAIKKEKSELINLMLQGKNKGLKTQPVKKKETRVFHCDTE